MSNDQELLDFAARLNELCDDMKVPPKGKARQTTLAKLFDVTQNGTRKWLEAEGYPSTAMTKRIAAWGKVSFEWLMTGHGSKLLTGDHPLVQRYNQADASTRALIDLALAAPGEPLPAGLSPSVRAMVDMARAALREEIKHADSSH